METEEYEIEDFYSPVFDEGEITLVMLVCNTRVDNEETPFS